MNVLWICNIPLPEASILLNSKTQPYGGWMVDLSERLSSHEGISLSITFPFAGIDTVRVLQGRNITYYAFPTPDEVSKVVDTVKPDIMQIWGTEYYHALVAAKAFNKPEKTLVHIQGLLSVYEKHYYANLPQKVVNRYTFRDLLKHDNIRQKRQKFIDGGKSEVEVLNFVKHITGRTAWDYACTQQINPDIKYHFCNESLRDSFYKNKWDISKCERHSIFVSQGSYPIKGLHLMLEAIPNIIRRFPDTKLYVGGTNIARSDTLKDKLRLSSYGKYIGELVRKNGLQGKVIFTGSLDEKQMCERYLKSHVFVSPSSIENSSNSLGEAMLLGVPCVASNVGGTADLLKRNDEGYLYPYHEIESLANYVCEVFENDDLARNFSENARSHAQKTHDRRKNFAQLISIYKEILSTQLLSINKKILSA